MLMFYQRLVYILNRFGLAVVVFLCVLAPLAFFAVKQEKVYEARALILFALGWEYTYVPEANQAGAKAPNPGDFEGFVNAEMLLLDNPQLVRTALETVNLSKVYPDLPNTEEGMLAGILALDAATGVELITGSYVVKVSVRHTDPLIAAELTNAMTAAFLNLRRGLYSAPEIRSITQRLKAAQMDSDQIDSQISDIVGSPDPSAFEAQLKTIGLDQLQMTSDLRAASLTLIGLKERHIKLQNQLGQDNELMEADVAIAENEARVAYLREQISANAAEISKMSAIMPRVRWLGESQKQQANRAVELEMRLRDAKAVAASGFDNVRVIESGVAPLRPISMPLSTRLILSAVVALVAAFAAFAISVLFGSDRMRRYGFASTRDFNYGSEQREAEIPRHFVK